MSELLLGAELEKLAAGLHTSVAELAFLSHLEVDDLRALRRLISAALFDRNLKRFKPLAESTRLLPNKLVAIISEKVIPPSISAQVTGLLKPEDAVDLAARLAVSYQAEICLSLDPRRAAPVLQAMPVSNVVKVAQELLQRRKFMVMAQFVDTLTDEQISSVAQNMDGEALLRIGFFVEADERLDQLISLLNLEQLQESIEAAALNHGALWPQVLSLVARLQASQRERLSSLLAQASPAVLSSLNEALFARDLWRDAVPFLEAMNEAAQELVIASLASHAENVADSQQHLSLLLPILSESLQRKIQLALGRV
ncbi:MAG: hypothetical protein ACSHXK_00015 [Oceanococcus sp.]